MARVEALFAGWPAWLAYLALFLGACARGSMLFAAGTLVRRGAVTRWSGHLDRPAVVRAESWVRRFGAPVVTVSFLTIGFQSAVNAAAGALRMPMRRYLPALAAGALLWAALYLFVGLAVLDALLGRVSWWWVVLAVGALLGSWAVGRRLVSRRPAR